MSTTPTGTNMTRLGKGLAGAAFLGIAATMTPAIADRLGFLEWVNWLIAGGTSIVWDLTWGYVAFTGLKALRQGRHKMARWMLGGAAVMMAASVAAMIGLGHATVLAALPVVAGVLIALGEVGGMLADDGTEEEIIAARNAARNELTKAKSAAIDIRVKAEAQVIKDAAEGDAAIAAEVLKVEIADRRHSAITAAMKVAGDAMKARTDETDEGVQAFQNAISRPLPTAPNILDLWTSIKPLSSGSAADSGQEVKTGADPIKRLPVPVADGLTTDDLTAISMIKAGATGAEIAEALKVSTSAVSQRLGRLAKNGHLTKVDGRWQIAKGA